MNAQATRAEPAPEMLGQIREVLTVKRVFGEPYEKNGLTILPVARVRGGWGGGAGSAEGERGEGSRGGGWGGGWGGEAAPAGVYVISEGTVDWRPAVDVNRVIMGAQIAVAILAVAWLRSRRRRRRE